MGSTSRSGGPRTGAITFAPVTRARWNDLARLFGPKGACAGCWCMWMRLPNADFRRRGPDGRRRALRGLVAAGDPPGLLAYDRGLPVGWCSVGPRADYRRLDNSRVLAPVDGREVWSVVCFFVARSHRRRGLTARMLAEALRHAARRGARLVEGYPLDLAGRRTAAAFAWNGFLDTFLAAGFREVARRSPTRPIVRRAVRPARPRAPRRG